MVGAVIYINEAEIKRRLGLLEGQSGKVIARAVNRSYTTGKKAIAKSTSQNYRIAQKEINSPKVLKITKARPTVPEATLEYTGGHRNLYLWNNKKAVSPNKVIDWSRGKPNVKVYKAAVARGHSPLPLFGSQNGKGRPFLQRVRKGERSDFTGLFQRENSDRDSKLVSVQSPAIPQIVKNAKVMVQFRRAAGPMLEKRLEHEIDAVLKGVVR